MLYYKARITAPTVQIAAIGTPRLAFFFFVLFPRI